MITTNTIGQRIKQRREDLKMSQEELSIKVGFKSRSSINKIELGKQSPKQSSIVALAKALDTTPNFLLGIDDEIRQRGQKVCDLFSVCYGSDACSVVKKFIKLDAMDRGKIEERIDTLLEADKYKEKDSSSLNAYGT